MEIIPREPIFQALRQFNPWWRGTYAPDWPLRRTAFSEMLRWMVNPPSHRALLVTGARRVGKTTLVYQVIKELINNRNVNPLSILYLTMDHPLIKLAGLQTALDIYRKDVAGGLTRTTFLMIDEIQFVQDWATLIKLMIDSDPELRLIATGSSSALGKGDRESGTGRIHVIKVPTLSFYEFLVLRNAKLPEIDAYETGLPQLFSMSDSKRELLKARIVNIEGYFSSYLLKGGFPESASIESDSESQRLLREDIVDRVLKRDLTVMFGTRNVLELEKLFLYLCLHQGGIFEVSAVASWLGTSPVSVSKYVNHLEDANLIYRLSPYNPGGKGVLRARYKYYLADASLANAILLRGQELFENPAALGPTVETSVFKHIFTRFYSRVPTFGYWRDTTRKREIDIVVKFPESVFPFEVKYRHKITMAELRGLLEFVEIERPERAYVITRELDDFSIFHHGPQKTPILRIPAFAFCYLCGLGETIEAATGIEQSLSPHHQVQ